MIKTVLVPTDGSEHAKKAVIFAADLAQKYDAKVIVLFVMRGLGSEDVPEALRSFARSEHIEGTDRDILESIGNQIVREAQALAQEHKAPEIETQLEVGDPASTILRVAKNRGINLIVMGSRGLGNLKGLLVGSVSHKVNQLSQCTCMTVK
jgi:nucleotide-binding universal stress UspA family protein